MPIKPRLNKKNIRRVLEIAEKSQRARTHKIFRFSIWADFTGQHKTVSDMVRHPCGTAGCIGGWGCVLACYDRNRDTPLNSQIVLTYKTANRFFGITGAEGIYLYHGHWHSMGINATTRDVITKLKNILKTGKIINPEFDKRYL